MIKITKKDLEIWAGFEELMQIAQSDIRAGSGETAGIRVPSQRTIEVYSDIVEAVEIHRDAQNGAAD